MKQIKDICFSELGLPDDTEKFHLDLYLPDDFDSEKLGRVDLKDYGRDTLQFCELNVRENEVCLCEYGIQGGNGGTKGKGGDLGNLADDTNDRIVSDCQCERDINDCSRTGLNANQDDQKTVQNKCRPIRCCKSKVPNDYSENTGTPFVVFIHGGGWKRGARQAWKHYLYYDVNFLVSFLQFFVRTYSNVGETLAENGIPCAVISYPLTEASLCVVLFEMFVSYIQCFLFTSVVSIHAILLAMLFRSVFTVTYATNTSWELIFNDQKEIHVTKLFILAVLLATNSLTLAIVFIKRRCFKLASKQCSFLAASLVLATSVIVSVASGVHMLLLGLNCVTMVISQGIILRVRLSRQRRTHEHQLQVVSAAVSWANTYCDRTQPGTPSSLYMMGHSAGGHLATLATLSSGVLDNNIHIKVIILSWQRRQITCIYY